MNKPTFISCTKIHNRHTRFVRNICAKSFLHKFQVHLHCVVFFVNTMDFILRFPPDLFVVDVLSFLLLKDLVILDTATCNTVLRSEFQPRLKNVLYWGEEIEFAIGGTALKWLSFRQMSLERMHVVNVSEGMFMQFGSAFALTKRCKLRACAISHQGFESFAQSSPLLEDLDLIHCNFPLWISGETVRCLFHCVHLRHLNLEGYTFLSNVDVDLVSRNCPNLVKLVLSFCHKISDAALLSLAAHSSGLESLYLAGLNITDIGLKALAQGCRALRCADLENCAYSIPSGISTAGCLALTTNCSLLQILSLAASRRVPGSILIDVLIPSFQSLQDLNVNGWTDLSDSNVQMLAMHCPQLVSLRIHDCVGLTDEAVIILAKHCVNLHTLCARSCEAFTDKSIVLLATRCTKLRDIDLDFSSITEKSINALAKHCKALVDVNVSHISSPFSVASVASLFVECPLLSRLGVSEIDEEIELRLFQKSALTMYPRVKFFLY